MYYHINDIIFLVRFPQFVGSLRRDVWTTAYWRDRATRSARHPYQLGLLRYRFAYRLYCSTSPRFSSFRFGLVESARLTSRSYQAVARKRVVRSANLRPVVTRREGIVVSSCARTKSRLVFYLMAIRNYASTPGTAYACTANWPGQADRRGYISIIRGNYYERPSSSILIFCSRPLRPPPRQRLNPALCFAMEMIL